MFYCTGTKQERRVYHHGVSASFRDDDNVHAPVAIARFRNGDRQEQVAISRAAGSICRRRRVDYLGLGHDTRWFLLKSPNIKRPVTVLLCWTVLLGGKFRRLLGRHYVGTTWGHSSSSILLPLSAHPPGSRVRESSARFRNLHLSGTLTEITYSAFNVDDDPVRRDSVRAVDIQTTSDKNSAQT
jgi:hypothetical protein